MDDKKIEWIQENYPFFSFVRYGKKEFTDYLGIVINTDTTITSMYNWEAMPTPELRKQFIELGEQWWWESNRMIPINLFLKKDFAQFAGILITFNIRDTEVVRGPSVSLSLIHI